MISVIIPAQNAAPSLRAVFQSLFDAAMDGLVSEVIVCDCGSTDATREIADAAGATVIEAGCGQQLLAGAQAARKEWLLFLHPDTALAKGWEDEVSGFIASGKEHAAVFRARPEGAGIGGGFRQVLNKFRASWFGLPRDCRALLIPARLLNAVGAASIPPIDEADLMRRLGRGRISRLEAVAVRTFRRP